MPSIDKNWIQMGHIRSHLYLDDSKQLVRRDSAHQGWNWPSPWISTVISVRCCVLHYFASTLNYSRCEGFFAESSAKLWTRKIFWSIQWKVMRCNTFQIRTYSRPGFKTCLIDVTGLKLLLVQLQMLCFFDGNELLLDLLQT